MSHFPDVFAELIHRPLDHGGLEKLAQGNLLAAQRPPTTATIEALADKKPP